MSDMNVGRRTNTLAIVGLILAFVFPLVGAIIGHVALGQIKKSGEEGRGLALGAVIVGWVFTGVGILAVFLTVIPMAVVGGMY
jgi:hypothetical protein